MSQDASSDPPMAELAGTDRASALFLSMIVQQANMALMLLGKVPDPQSGQTLHDLDAAKMFIDQLEMLEVKTKGNLSPPEEKALKQSLATVRMAFVEVVESAPKPSGTSPAPAPEAAKDAAPAAAAKPPPQDESRKRFTKKY